MDLYAFFQSEVKPTIGCTEPGAVAYAAAVAARHLPTQPEGIRLEMSVAIYKNGRSVGIPGTNGLRGLTLACVLGALGGNPDKGLMALEDIPADTVEQAQAFIDAGKMAEEVVQGTPSMWARVTLSGGGHTVSCTVARKHDHVERLVADGAVLVDQPLEAQSGGTDWTDELTAMHFEELWNLALGIDDAIVRQMLEGARMNMAILDHAGTEQAGIVLEEQGRGEPLLGPPGLQLRVGEGDPQLVDLALGEERVDELDAGAQESDVGHPALGCGLGAAPHAGPLDVDPDVSCAAGRARPAPRCIRPCRSPAPV